MSAQFCSQAENEWNVSQLFILRHTVCCSTWQLIAARCLLRTHDNLLARSPSSNFQPRTGTTLKSPAFAKVMS
jgi:hypothetical protein